MLVIAGAGIAGTSLLYHLSEMKYKRKVVIIDNRGIGKRNVSMFAFREKLVELLPILQDKETVDYAENLCNFYSYSMIEKEGLVDYRSVEQPNVVEIINYQKLCQILFEYAQKHLKIEFIKGKITKENGQILMNDEILNYDLFIDAMGSKSPLNDGYYQPNRYYQLYVKEFQNIPENLKNNVRMIVNVTKGGCWIYPNQNNSGFEIGVGVLTDSVQRNDQDTEILKDAMQTIETKLNIPPGDEIKAYFGNFAMEPLVNLFDPKRRMLRVGDAVGMIDSYTGTGALVIIEEMKFLADCILQRLMLTRSAYDYNQSWQKRLKEYYLGRTARSVVMFGKHMNDDRWRKVLIKRAKADSTDVIEKASGHGTHSFWFNLKLLHPRVLLDFIFTKRRMKKNFLNYKRIIKM